MPYEQGLSDWRVYSAEQSVGHDRDIDLDEAQRLIDQAVTSDWFREWFPHTPSIEVVVAGAESPELRLIQSYAAPWGYPRPTRWRISLHPRMLTARVLLHEMAHCIQPVYEASEGMRTNDEYVLDRTKHRVHGEYFTASLGVITDNMLPGDGGQLFAACRHYEAPIASQEALRHQLAAQSDILDDEQRWYDEILEQSAAIEARYEAEHGAPRKVVIPQPTWGFHIRMMRRGRRIDGRLVSQQQVAEAVAKVTPCSPRHISSLENFRERPDDPAQLKRAMLATIFLGFDPIWTRYNLGLTRWDCGGITLREARAVNWRWAKLVSQLNRMLREMPPRWNVEGGR